MSKTFSIGSYIFLTEDEYRQAIANLSKIRSLCVRGDLTDSHNAQKLLDILDRQDRYASLFQGQIGGGFRDCLRHSAAGQPVYLGRFLESVFDDYHYEPKAQPSSDDFASEAAQAESEQALPHESLTTRKKHPVKFAMREALIFIGGVAICVALYYGGGELYYRYQSARSASNLQKIADLMQIGPDIARADDGKGTVALPSGAANPTEDAPAIPATPTPEAVPSGSDPATGDTSDEGDSGAAPGGGTLPAPTPEPQVMYQFSAVYDMNPDIVAWIAIDDTPINYPVMQTKGDEEFYIQRNFEKKQDLNGLPFMDERCDIAAPTVNTIVYAHNMRNGSMFATLLKYKDEAFYKAHPIIHFSTLYETADYEIIAAFRSRVAYVNEVTFRYYNFIDTASPEDFDSFIDSIKGLTPYDIEHTAGFGDSLLTLSTCDRTIDDGRYVVVAKKVE